MESNHTSLTQPASIIDLPISLLWNYIDFNPKRVSMHLCWKSNFVNVLAFLTAASEK
jgi:hypothetical protein